MDRPETRVDPIPPHHCHLKEHESSESITKQNIDEFGAIVGCPGCSAIKDNMRAQAHSYRCRVRNEECLRITPQGAERLDRRSDVRNEAPAEEIQRGEERKKRSDNTAAAIPEPEPAASAARDLRESPIEPDPNPKRRLLMKSVDCKVRRGQSQIQGQECKLENAGNGQW